jgi:membrane protease YdiL (CAAX protease family)
VFRQIGLVLSVQESPILRALLPRSTGERSLFGLLSIAAGVGEEVAYRGYAIPVLAPLVGPAGAVAVTSAVFGVLHTYQGALGIGRTATMGAVLAWGFLASGSLIPSIIAHTAIDVIAGIMIAERLMLPESRSGVHEPTSPETEHRA